MSADVLAEKIGNVDERIINYAKTCKNGELTTKGFTSSLEGMTIGAKAGQVALKGLAIAGNMIAMWAITEAIQLVVKAVDEAIVTTEEYREKLSELKTEASTMESDLSSMNDEFVTTGERIKELEGKGKLTFTEKEEYENLVQQNNELERSIELLKQEQQIKNQEKNKAFVDTMKSDVKDNTEYTSYDGGDIFQGNSIVYSFSGYVYDPQTEQAYIEQQFEKRKQLLDEKTVAETTEEKERIQGEIDEINAYLVEKSQQWQSDADGIQYIPNPSTDDEKAVNEWLDFIEDFRDRMAITSADADDTAKTNAFNRIVDNWQFDDTVQGLQDLGEQGKVTADMLDDSKYDDFINKLVEIGVIDSADNLNDVADAFNNIATAEDEVSNNSEPSISYDELSESAESATGAVDTLRSAISSINDAFAEQAENGSISVDTMLAMVDAGYATALQFDEATGACTINKEAMLELVQAKIQNQIADLQTLQTDIATKLIDDGLIASESAKGFIALADAKAAAATAEQLASVDDYNDATAKIKALENAMKNIDKIGKGSYSTSKKSKPSSGSSSKSSKSPKDELKEQFQAEYDLLKHNLEMNYITEEQYYNGVQALNEKYYAGKSEYLDEYRKYEEEVYKGLKSYYKSYCDSMVDYYEKALDANKISFGKYVTDVTALVKSMWDTGKISAEDYWNYVHDILTKQINIYDSVISAATQLLEDEIDKLNDEIDALEEKNDALNKEKDNYDSILSVVDDVYQKEIDKLNEQKEILQDKIQAINDANDALDLQYRKEEAIYALRKAQEQRTKKVN